MRVSLYRRLASSASSQGSLGTPTSKDWEKVWAQNRRAWEYYFETVTADTAVEPPRVGIRPTVDAISDTREHPFITEPVLATFHRVAEVTKQDPFITLYYEYMDNPEPARAAELRKYLHRMLPGKFEETMDQVLAKSVVQYPFIEELKKQVAEGKAKMKEWENEKVEESLSLEEMVKQEMKKEGLHHKD